MVPFTVAFMVPLAAQLRTVLETRGWRLMIWRLATDDYNVHLLGA